MKVEQRRYGQSSWTLSSVCFGTMRMEDSADTQGLLEHLFDLGVDTHHSSHEYDAHPQYLRRLADARGAGREFKHIVKLANPHFGEDRFDPKSFVAAVERALAELQADAIHNVQWLLRSQPIEDSQRLPMLDRDREIIDATFGELLASGKVLSFSCFPYSTSFAEKALNLEAVSGLTTYLNLLERDYLAWIDEHHPFIAIRPIAAGKLKQTYVDGLDRSMQEVFQSLGVDEPSLLTTALRFPLLHPYVTSMIVSVRDRQQADEVARVAATVEPDDSSFQQLLEATGCLPDFAAV